MVRSVNDRYPTLFGKDVEEDVQEGEGSEEERRVIGEDSSASFSQKWGWFTNVVAVGETLRMPTLDVYKLPVMVFLNVVCYNIDRSNYEKSEIEKFKRTH